MQAVIDDYLLVWYLSLNTGIWMHLILQGQASAIDTNCLGRNIRMFVHSNGSLRSIRSCIVL